MIPMMREYTVFNVQQCDGLPVHFLRRVAKRVLSPKRSVFTRRARRPSNVGRVRRIDGIALNLLPSSVCGGGKSNTKGKPFGMKARPRIGTYLAEPICAKGLNGACQEDDAKTCDV
jgi:hypothetical protein